MALSIADELRERAPGLSLGVVTASVRVGSGLGTLWKEVLETSRRTASRIGSTDALVETPEIQAARAVFRACGKKPQRYRVSSEALLRRAIQEKPLHPVNNVVDINNLVSLSSLHSVGSYDLASIDGDLEMRIGASGESYRAIGGEAVGVEGLPVFADSNGACGSPWRDSDRTRITEDTTRIVTLIISFSGEDGLDEHLDLACSRLEQYASAAGVDAWIVR